MGVPATRDHGQEPGKRGPALSHHDHRGYMQIASEENLRGGQPVSCGRLSQTSRRRSRFWRRGGSFTKPPLSCGSRPTPRAGGRFGEWAPTPAQTRRCACWGVSPGFKARERIRSHRVHQVITAPFEGHSKKPDETRRRIVELLGDVPRLELFARDRAPGWDAWGNEAPPEE